MNQIITNFLQQAKSKLPPGLDNPDKLPQYTVSEFHDQAMNLMVLYEFADTLADKQVLKQVYDKMWSILNPLNRGCVLNPSALDVIDKQIKEHGKRS